MTPRTERVTYRPEGKRARTVILSNVREMVLFGADGIIGEEVDKDGLNVLPKGEDGESRRVHIIDGGTIVRRVQVRMDNIYGEFVEFVEVV